MIKSVFQVPDVEHQGDIDYFKSIIQDAGGTILRVVWNEEDDDDVAYIVFQCRDKNHKKEIKLKLENE